MTQPGGAAPGDHYAGRLEDRLHAVLERGLGRVGWGPTVVPFTGYGLAGSWVRVLARVLLSPPGSQTHSREDLRGWRRFVSQSSSGTEVTIGVGERTWTVRANREGYVDVRVPAPLEQGWASVTVTAPGADPVACPVRVIAPGATNGLVSDIDDTVIVTRLPEPLVAFRNAFLLPEAARRPVPGMSGLYADLVAADPDLVVVYLSTGAWNTAPALAGFLERHGFPAGPMLLTDWGPTPRGWFRSGPEHKRQQLDRLVEELPDVQWLLVGDDGQHDPSIYAAAAARHPDRVRGIALRQLSPGEQVVGHGTARARDDSGGHLPGDPVTGPDGDALRSGLRARGLLP